MKKLLVFIGTIVVAVFAFAQTQNPSKKLKVSLPIHVSAVANEPLPKAIKSDNSKMTTAVSCRSEQSGNNYFQGDVGFEQCKRDTQSDPHRRK